MLFVPIASFAQDDPDEVQPPRGPSIGAQAPEAEQPGPEAGGRLELGQLDFSASAIYHSFEFLGPQAGLDVGIAPIADGLSLSLGVRALHEWCLGCDIPASERPPDGDPELRSRKFSIRGNLVLRVTVEALPGALPAEIYFGPIAGWDFHRIRVQWLGDESFRTEPSVLVGGLAGLRFFPFFSETVSFFLEVSGDVDLSQPDLSLRASDWPQPIDILDTYSGDGAAATLGISIRF